MFGLDNNNQYVDWWHEALPGSGESFDHEGTLTSIIIKPSITIGLSNYWNMTISQVFGVRSMTWGKDWDSVHHREEDSSTDFKKIVEKITKENAFKPYPDINNIPN